MRHFEEVEVGQVTPLGPYTVSEEEIVAFGRRYDPQPFHVDPEAARQSIFGGLIASGWHTCAVMMRLSVEAGGDGLGSPGIESCRWVRPVRPGDTLTGRMEVLDKRPSDSESMGIVRWRVELVNQRGEVVLAMVRLTTFRRRPEAAG